MAITATFNEYNGSGEVVETGVSDITFGSTDETGFESADYPLRVGESSVAKYFKVAFAGFVGETVSDAKIYLSTSGLLTGENITLNGLGPVTFSIPSNSPLGNSEIPTSLPDTQNLALGGSDSGTLTADGESDYFVLQRTVNAETPIGQLPTVTITVSFDVA